MIDYDEACARMSALTWELPREQLPLAEAVGRVLAADVAMDRDQPPFDRATMDGYALNPIEGQASYAVVGSVHAGEIREEAVHGGEAVRIMTGAPTPANCTVVPIERCEVSGTSVTIADAADRKPGRNVAWRGEDAAKGAVVVAAGSRLSPAVLGAVAMAGAERVSVYAAPRIAIRTTGDEVGGSGEAGIADSNGPLLTALCQSLGLPSDRAHAKDTMSGLEAALAPGGADCVITTGGVSMGDRDLVPAAAAAAGFETIFHRVAIQPGKPVLLARHGDGRLLLGLPGNPVSVLATAHLFLLPLLERCWPGFDSGWRTISTAETIANPKRRRLFRPAALGPTGVGLVPWNGSGDLLAASHGDGVVDLVPGASVDAGGQVRFLPWVGQRLGAGSLLPPRR